MIEVMLLLTHLIIMLKVLPQKYDLLQPFTLGDSALFFSWLILKFIEHGTLSQRNAH